MTKRPTVLRRLDAILYKAAGTDTWREGKEWYAKARSKCVEFYVKHNVSMYDTCGLFAIANINSSWEAVDKVAYNLWAYRKGMRVCVDKVTRLFGGAYYSEIFSPNSKTYNFAMNLHGSLNLVTVDRHMFNAAGTIHGKPAARMIQSCVTELAARYNLQPAQAQAIIWLQYRKQIKEKSRGV